MTKYTLPAVIPTAAIPGAYAVVKSVAWALLLLIFSVPVAAQQAKPLAATDLPPTLKPAIQHYQMVLGKTTQLYNGAEYIRPFPLAKGSPFLDSGDLQQGAIYFDGVFYPDVPIAYDLVNQEVITPGYQQINIRLVPEKIGYFYIGNRLFIPTQTESVTHNKSTTGYYEVLYHQGIRVLAHYEKRLKQSSGTESPQTFIQYTTYYLLKDNSLQSINNERTLVAALANHKEEVKHFLRTNQLNFKKAPAETIVKTVAFYTQLNN